MTDTHLGASFRDPSGFLFSSGGVLYRQVNLQYQKEYDLLMQSGLYTRLVKEKKLIPHQEVETSPNHPEIAYRVIEPEKVEFISYPYEWSFSQLKDAALLTLSIQKIALEFGMSLKDASAYNIQFHHGRPILIDTLSFESYYPGEPWVAYRQFCQHFLAPLALMSYCDIRLNQWMQVAIDGIPLDLASKLLPFKTRLQFGLLAHIHAHATAQKKFTGQPENPRNNQPGRRMDKTGLLGIIDSLYGTVSSLKWQPKGTPWAEYYDSTNYSQAAFEQKKKIVASFVEKAQPKQVWDLGANTGVFSRLASNQGCFTVASDIDPAAVEQNYLVVKKQKETKLLPLVLDLTNPSPSIGWQNRERDSFISRGPVDLVMALALVHHLAISNNVPLPSIAEFFARCASWLIIEFIPKEDSQVQRLLATRQDIFPGYTQENFEQDFCELFALEEAVPIQDSKRVMYLMKRREPIGD